MFPFYHDHVEEEGARCVVSDVRVPVGKAWWTARAKKGMGGLTGVVVVVSPTPPPPNDDAATSSSISAAAATQISYTTK